MPNTLEENVNRVKAAKTAIGNAITAKGGTVGANDGLEDFAADIATIPSGGVEFSNSPVNFTLITNIRNLDVVIPNGITQIDSNAFYNCIGLRSIQISNSVITIGESAFRNTGLTSIELPNSITIIGNYCFRDNILLNYVKLSNSITYIPTEVFAYCTVLTSIDLPNTITRIDSGAFYNCTALTSIEIPSGVTSISSDLFYNCTALTSIEIPSGVTSIGRSAFENCGLITSIEIPSGVTSIGRYAFRHCTSLQSIKFTSATPPTIGGTNTFQNVPTTCIIYVPTGSLTAYTSAANYPDPNTYTYVEY